MQRHHLLTIDAQSRAGHSIGLGCVVMFVSGMECQCTHRSRLARAQLCLDSTNIITLLTQIVIYLDVVRPSRDSAVQWARNLCVP